MNSCFTTSARVLSAHSLFSSDQRTVSHESVISNHSLDCLHRSPSTPGTAPSCPPACSPSSPEPRSASLYLYDAPGWPARSALHHATKRSRQKKNCFHLLLLMLAWNPDQNMNSTFCVIYHCHPFSKPHSGFLQ